MTDKKIEIEFGIDGRVTGPLATSLRQAHDFAAEIERMFGRTADLGKEMSKQLAQIKAQNKALSAGLGGLARGTPTAQVVNTNTSFRNANNRADSELAGVLQGIQRELGPGASEARVKRAFREVMISQGVIGRAPNNTARSHAAQNVDPLFAMAKAGVIAERAARLNADFDRAQRENRARDYVEHRKSRLNGERFEDNSMRANAAHDDRVRTRALKQIDKEEGWARDSLMADARHDDRMRTAAIKQAEKEAGHRDASLLRAAQWEDSQRTKAEARAQKYAASMLRAGDLNGMLARGNTEGAAALLQRARGTLSGRPGVDDQFIDGLLREAGGKVDAQRAIKNIRAAEAELKALFNGINKFATAAERQEILGNGARDIASRRGLNPNVLDRTADDLEGVRGTRDRVLGMPVRPEPRPQRAPGRGSSMLGRLGGRMELFADYAGISAIVGAVGYTASQVVGLEKSLATLKSISGATDGQMMALSKTIKEVGQSSTYSLAEISAAATTLAQAGYTVSQVAAVLPDITSLALASGSDLQTSTDIVSSVLTVFDMNLRESGYVADALVQALNGSKLSMDQFALGMQYAGNAAAQGGVSFEDLAAALGAMSNAGIRSGSTLGTGLTAVFQELMAPTQKLRDHLQEQGVAMSAVDLKTHGLVEVLNTLQDAQIDSSKGFELFDTRAARAYSALVNNKTILQQLSENFEENGAATAAAAIQMDTFLAQLNRLGNATVQFTEVFGAPLIDALKASMSGLADLLVGLANADPLVRALTTAGVTLGITMLLLQKQAAATTLTMTGLWAAMSANIAAFQRFVVNVMLGNVALGSLGAGLLAATRATLAFTVALLNNPFTWVAVGLAALVGTITYFSGATERAKNAADKFKEAAAQERAEVEELTTTIDELNKFTAKLADYQGDTNSAVDEAVRKFAKYGFELDKTITKTEDLAAATRGFSEELAALRLERAQAEQAALNEQNAALQDIARGNLGRAGNALTRSTAPGDTAAARRFMQSEPWRAAAADGTTSTELRALINYLTQRQNDEGLSVRMVAALQESITNLEANGLPLSLSELSRNQIMAGVTGTDAAIATSPTFQGYGTRMSTRRAGWLAAMDNGELSVENQRDFRVRAEPAMRADITSTANTILSELETSRGTPYNAQERQELLATILVKLRENADFAAMLAAYDSNPDYWNDTRITSELSDLEGQQRSASTAARPGILTRIEALKKTQLGRRSDTTSEQDASDLASYLSGLDTNVNVRQGARSQNRALSQNTANARTEAELAAARVNTGLVRTNSGTWIRPIDAAEGSPFGATTGRTGPHRGSDYPAGIGTQVVAPMGGMASSGFSEANGNFVRIDHGNGFESVLIHLNEAAAGLSAVAKQVEQGQEVGRSGNTGASDGPHLHWQLKLNGEVIDPESMVGQQAVDAAAEIISTAQEDFEGKWQGYVTARLAQFEDQTSEMTTDEKAQERTALMNDLALEKAEMLKKNLADVYEVILANFEIQAEDAVQYALAASARGEDSQVLEALARAAIIRQRVAAVAAARASMEDGDAEDTAVAGIMREYAARLSGLTVGMLEGSANYVARQAEREARNQGLALSIRQGVIDARSNPNAERNGSRALDIIRGRDPERLAEDRQREQVRIAQSNDDMARRRVSDAEEALGAEGLAPARVTELQATLQAAQDAAEATALSLKEAEISLSSMTAEAEVFRTPMDAIRGSWDAFIEQANLGRPVLSTLADGLLESFKGAKEGFKTLIVDVLSGTKSMGDAFKDLAVSILGSLLDLAAEILAQQLLTMIITSLIPGGFGGGAKTGLGGKSGAGFGMKPGYYQGGMIPRRAAGGMAPSPNRDSVMTFMQPGEFVMSKTATDFIGADTLSEMNASGNRRMKNLPTVASSMPKRVPDEVNVWVVPPTQRPPLGKKDIIAAVTDDMMMNGQTKRLIKAIQVGAM